MNKSSLSFSINTFFHQLYKHAKYRGFFGEKNKLHSPFYERYHPRLPLYIIDTRIIISHKYKFLLVRVPKAGQSTVVASLYHAETGKRLRSTDDIQPIKVQYYEHPSSLTGRQFDDIEKNYFKFTFVRHPYTRVLSAYQDKIEPNIDKKRVIAEVLNKDENEINFQDFIKYLEYGKINSDPHWARQVDLLTIPLSKFDYIGKLENINKDLPYVLKTIYGRSGPIVSVKNHATQAQKKVANLSKKEKEKIYTLYKSGFETFGYSKEYIF